MKFKALLKQSGLSRKEFAVRLGISDKTTYWKGEAPGYAIAYLKLYIESKEHAELVEVMRRVLNEQT